MASREPCLLIVDPCVVSSHRWPREWGRRDTGEAQDVLQLSPRSLDMSATSEKPALRSPNHKEKLCVGSPTHGPSWAASLNRHPWDELFRTSNSPEPSGNPSPGHHLTTTTGDWPEWKPSIPVTHRTMSTTHVLFQTNALGVVCVPPYLPETLGCQGSRSN